MCSWEDSSIISGSHPPTHKFLSTLRQNWYMLCRLASRAHGRRDVMIVKIFCLLWVNVVLVGC